MTEDKWEERSWNHPVENVQLSTTDASSLDGNDDALLTSRLG
jgi:hypothetical protein